MVKNKLQTSVSKKVAKSAAQRQAERRARVKKDDDMYAVYLEKQRKLTANYRSKMSEGKKEKQRKKESARRKELRNKKSKDVNESAEVASPPYKARSTLMKAVHRADSSLPFSPRKKRAVVKELACKVKLDFSQKKKKLSSITVENGIKEIEHRVVAFYNNENVSRWTPGKQEYVSVRNDSGEKIKLQKRYLSMTLQELYALFKKENPNIKVGKSKFCSLRPKNILLSSSMPHNTCQCKYHENIVLLLEALHKISPVIPVYSSGLIDQIVCSSPNIACWFNKCDSCKDAALFKKLYPAALLDIDELDTFTTWYQWQDTINSFGKNSVCKVQHEGLTTQLYQEFCSCIPKFIHHHFIKNMQHKSYERCKLQLGREGYAMIQFDFAENFACEWQDAPQSTHWYKEQITLFTCIIWHQHTAHNFVVVSDDRGHNKHSIVVFIDTLLDFLPKGVQEVDIWSDGPCSQFKNKFIAALLPFFQQRKNIIIKWNYFAAGHGKGPVDGVGGILKRYVTSKIMTRKAHVHDVDSFAKATEGCEITIVCKKKSEIDAFLESNKIDDLYGAAQKIDNIFQIHTLQFIDGKYVVQKWEGEIEEQDALNITNKAPDTDGQKPAATNKNTVECIDLKHVNEGMWVKVRYEGEWFIGKIIKKVDSAVSVRCLTMPFGIGSPQEMERETDAVYYKEVFSTGGIKPTLVKVGRSWKYTYDY